MTKITECPRDRHQTGGRKPGTGTEQAHCPVIVPFDKWGPDQQLLIEAFGLTAIGRAIRRGARWVRGEPGPVPPTTEWRTIDGVTYEVAAREPEHSVVITPGPGSAEPPEDVRWDASTFYVPGTEEQCANAVMDLLNMTTSISLVRTGTSHTTWIDRRPTGEIRAITSGTTTVPEEWRIEPKLRVLRAGSGRSERATWLAATAQHLLQAPIHRRAGIGNRMWEVLVGRTITLEDRDDEVRDYRRGAFHWTDTRNGKHMVRVLENDQIMHYRNGEPIGTLQTSAIKRRGDEKFQDRRRLVEELNQLVLKWDTEQGKRP